MILDSFNLTNKTALVTGSTRGLGAAMARALSEAGATVATHGRDPSRGPTLSADISDAAQCERLGGTISVESVAGSGTTFLFSFPRRGNEHSLAPPGAGSTRTPDSSASLAAARPLG